MATGVTGYLSLLDYVRDRSALKDLSAECVVAHWTLLHMSPDTGELEDAQAYFTQMAFAAVSKRHTKETDPDMPNFRDAMSGPHCIKRLRNGDFNKFKARICVRGDLQEETDRETYAPVVKWPTIRTVLAFAVKNNLITRQIDFVNSFVQASMPDGEDVYVSLPPGIHMDGHVGDSTVLLKLRQSLYGMTQSPLLWFMTLKNALGALGYTQSQHDQCLFINQSLKSIVLVYGDDCLCFAHDDATLDALVTGLCTHKLILDEQALATDVYAYLSIEVNLTGDIVELKQTGLIDKILRTVGMDVPSVTPNDVPAKEQPLGKALDASPFAETWDYASVIGMLLYLENTRPDIQFAVNQCARFMQDPRVPHARAVKKICRYLKGTRTRGLCFKSTPSDPTKPILVD